MQVTLNSLWKIALVCSPHGMEKDKEREVRNVPPPRHISAGFQLQAVSKSMHASALMS